MARMTECRACRSRRVHLFLPLGPHPAANAFLRPEKIGQPEARFDLDVHVCLDCALIQVPNCIPPDFFRDYVYVPSASQTMHEHFAELARKLVPVAGPGGLVVDIGSNDGLFLGFMRDRGGRTLGVEPARNLTETARAKGLEIVNEYFVPELARQIVDTHGRAAVIVTTNTFNHIDDLAQFMEGIRILLDERGTFIVEVPHALDLVEQHEFDTMYHEHLSAFSVKSLVELYAVFGLSISDIEPLKIHGGSLRVYARHNPTGVAASGVVGPWLEREERAHLFSTATYTALRGTVDRLRDELLMLLRNLKQSGKRIAGYGAPAKGNTLLNYYRIGPELLDCLVDRNSHKHGLYSPGMHIPVVGPDWITTHSPDYLLVLAWNFADEIMRQQESFRRGGGRFILPIPEVSVVG